MILPSETATEASTELCGPVITDRTARPWIGAERATNNTAELHAMFEALDFLKRHPEIPAAVIRPDSEIAMDLTTGTAKPKRNQEMVRNLRRMWETVREERGGNVWMQHVRAHRNQKWNERADKLADKGEEGTIWAGGPRWQGWPERTRRTWTYRRLWAFKLARLMDNVCV